METEADGVSNTVRVTHMRDPADKKGTQHAAQGSAGRTHVACCTGSHKSQTDWHILIRLQILTFLHDFPRIFTHFSFSVANNPSRGKKKMLPDCERRVTHRPGTLTVLPNKKVSSHSHGISKIEGLIVSTTPEPKVKQKRIREPDCHKKGEWVAIGTFVVTHPSEKVPILCNTRYVLGLRIVVPTALRRPSGRLLRQASPRPAVAAAAVHYLRSTYLF